MLTKSQISTAVLLLRQASASVQWVSTLFFGVGNSATAARLNDVSARLSDEVKLAENMIPQAPDQGGHA